jgi:hypothetical protein
MYATVCRAKNKWIDEHEDGTIQEEQQTVFCLHRRLIFLHRIISQSPKKLPVPPSSPSRPPPPPPQEGRINTFFFEYSPLGEQ